MPKTNEVHIHINGVCGFSEECEFSYMAVYFVYYIKYIRRGSV